MCSVGAAASHVLIYRRRPGADKYMELEVRIGDLRLEHPLINAAGVNCRLIDEVEQLALAPVAAITVGSITLEPRSGHQGNVLWLETTASLNSLGLPNPGVPYYRDMLPRMAASAQRVGKPLLVSVAGFSPEEYGELALFAAQHGADLVELNLGCPNVWEGQEQKLIPSFHPILVAEILSDVQLRLAQAGLSLPISVKVSPISDPSSFQEVAQVLTRPEFANLVTSITAVNTFPNAFAWEGIRAAIDPAGGLAGLGGPALKHICQGQVKQWRSLLPVSISIIGVGGVSSGEDVRELIRAGATAVGVATAFAQRGIKVFEQILSQYVSME